MGRLSKAAAKRRDREIRRAVEVALSSNSDHERAEQLESTLAEIQRLIHAALKPQAVSPELVAMAREAMKKRLAEIPAPRPLINPATLEYITDSNPNGDPVELDDSDNMGEGRWL